MPITVELRAIDGRLLDRITDEHGEITQCLADLEDHRYPYLRYIDPYGITVFNPMQMAALIPELERASASNFDSW